MGESLARGRELRLGAGGCPFSSIQTVTVGPVISTGLRPPAWEGARGLSPAKGIPPVGIFTPP